jgi:hypothetical protein
MKCILFSFLSLTLLGCIKNNPDPSWIEISEWTLEANPESVNPTGHLSHQFTDAWVYVNDDLIGVFELPIKVPVLGKDGAAKIRVVPTILNNGISATKKIYPFVEPYIIEATLVANQTVKVAPVTRYYKDLKFWIEDFEDAAVKIDSDPDFGATMSTGNDPAKLKYGNYYGIVNLNLTDNIFYGYTNGKTPLGKGQEVYLEIDYRSTNSLVTGLLEISSSQVKNHPYIQLNPQDPSTVKWKKIYMDLREIISGTPLAEYYEVSLTGLLDEGKTDTEIIIDNIKLVRF